MAITEEKLSDKEIGILQALADGEKPAKRFRCSQECVRQRLYRIREKLESPTTYNAIATALRQGIID